jgi:flagellar basal body P-ring formation protein FlgA
MNRSVQFVFLIRFMRAFLLGALPGGAFVHGLPAQDSSAWLLKTNAVVTSRGIYLADVAIPPAGITVPHVRIADAPAFGSSLTWQPAQVNLLVTEAMQVNPGTNWLGSPRVLISRNARTLTESGVQELLTEKLTADYLSQGGELELRLVRKWTEVPIPDEPLVVKLSQLPAQGVMQSFSVRLELANDREKLGSWQIPVRASLWKDVWVAQRNLKRGEVLQPGDLGRERRDVLVSRNHIEADTLDVAVSEWEVAENLNSGGPLNRWSVRRKPVVYRGQLADALVHNGSLTISLKVQVLEDAIPGQPVRVRNPNTKRELQGKVNHDQTISIQL